MNSSHTGQVLRQRGIAIAASGLGLQLLGTLGLLITGPMGVITLLLLLGTGATLAASYTTLNDRTGMAMKLQAATVLGAAICIFMGSGFVVFLVVLLGAVASYVGTSQLAAGLAK